MSTLSNPATYLYLNPSLQATRTAIDVEAATSYWNTNPASRSLPKSLPVLPDTFDPYVFLAENRDIIDVSTMNQVIYRAMSNEGRDVRTLWKNAAYHGTIFQPAKLITSNTFKFLDPSYTISPCNLQVNDLVKIGVNSNHQHIFGTVSNISLANQAFSISTANSAIYSDSNASYIVYGLSLFDAERLSLVNLANIYDSTPAKPSYPYVVPLLEKEFNVDLYHMLYPDARMMSQTEAYIDYTDNWGAKSYRITKASDIENIRAPGVNFVNLSVDNTLSVGPQSDRLLVADSTARVVTVHGPLITDSINVRNDAIVQGTLDAGSGALHVSATSLVSDVNSTFSSNVVMDANLTVVGASTFKSDINATSNLIVQEDVLANRFFAWSSIGIGASGIYVGQPETPPGVGMGSGTIAVGGGGGGTGGGGTGGTGGWTTVPDPLVVGTVIAGTSISVGAGPWTFTDTISATGALTLHHPSMGANSHIFDVSGKVGLNITDGATSAAPPLEYSLVMQGDVFTTGSVISQSDRRYKSDLKVIDSPLSRLTSLTGYTYRNSSSNTSRCTGLLAQDVDLVLPEAVHIDSDGLMSVAYGNLAGLFVEAFKEMKKEIEKLRDQVQILSHASLP